MSRPKDLGSIQINIEPKNLEQMEGLLRQSTLGFHLLFDRTDLVRILGRKVGTQDQHYDFNQVKRVQDVMSNLIGKKTYYEKLEFIRRLDEESFGLVVKTYFHIVENSLKSSGSYQH